MQNRSVLYIDYNVENFSRVQEILSREENFILRASNNTENFKDLIKDTHPEAIIINIDPAEHTKSFKILSWVKTTHFQIQCLLLGHHQKFLSPAIEQGASGYVLIEELDQLPMALQSILAGNTYFPALTKDDLTQQVNLKNRTKLIRDTWHSLSEKEMQIVALKKLGWSSQHISEMYRMPLKTLQSLTASILDKTHQPSMERVLEVYEDLVEEITEE